MSQVDTDSIRRTAEWLKLQSVTSNGDQNAYVTKKDLENLKNNVAKAIAEIADAMDG